MSWRAGCQARPPVAAGAEAVRFDFAAADEVGERLDRLRRAVAADLAVRAGASGRLADWAGAHRITFDERRRAFEAVLSGAELDVEVARLRTAWDAAVVAQLRANRATAVPR